MLSSNHAGRARLPRNGIGGAGIRPGRLMALLLLAAGVTAAPVQADPAPQVKLVTTQGEIVLELDAAAAPLTVQNFLEYVDAGFYDGTIFHRVIPGFMIQGGGFTPEFRQKPTRDPVTNEADNGLANTRGTIAMARTSAPHSATAQFFINLVDNPFLDHRNPSPRGWGYAVFGRVVAGMDTVDAIAAIPTGRSGPFRSDVPQTGVIIERAERLPVAAPADGESSP